MEESDGEGEMCVLALLDELRTEASSLRDHVFESRIGSSGSRGRYRTPT